MQQFQIQTRNANESAAIQRLAFDAGWRWISGSTEVQRQLYGPWLCFRSGKRIGWSVAAEAEYEKITLFSELAERLYCDSYPFGSAVAVVQDNGDIDLNGNRVSFEQLKDVFEEASQRKGKA